MKKVDHILKNEIDDLLKIGTNTQAKVISRSDSIKDQELSDVSSWVTKLGQLIKRLYGKESQQFQIYSEALQTRNFWSIRTPQDAA